MVVPGCRRPLPDSEKIGPGLGGVPCSREFLAAAVLEVRRYLRYTYHESTSLPHLGGGSMQLELWMGTFMLKQPCPVGFSIGPR
jgi:hypothetical protein